MQSEMTGGDIQVGRYRGAVADGFSEPGFLDQLAKTGELVVLPGVQKLSEGRNRNVRLDLDHKAGRLAVAVKAFGEQSSLKDMIAVEHGSKARRTWLAARFLARKEVGTPQPVAFLERWEGSQLAESYYLSVYQDTISSFRDELVWLFRDDPECWKVMSLLQCVAKAIGAMHQAGFRHNDLGNQNILLRRTGDGQWGGVQFIDLNRARFDESGLSLEERARDISRIYLPSDLLRVFKEMYFGDEPPPEEFQEAERYFRRLYRIHSQTRRFRHPIRAIRGRRKEHLAIKYPIEKDMWIWDERSGQPINVMRPKDRNKFYPLSRHLHILGSTAAGLLPVWAEYRTLLKECFRKPVEMNDRIGVAVEPSETTWDRESGLLEGLGRVPVLVRFYANRSSNDHKFRSEIVKQLDRQKHRVSIALVQDRRSVLQPERWDAFVEEVFGLAGDSAESAEICHAINRVKWGIWDFEEHRRLLDGVEKARSKHPGLKLMGPAAIDFEYPSVMAALDNLPAGMRFDSLSHHLYVDRRGAPEEKQGGFSALEKFALARAIARWSGSCGDSLVVSEVNWPIKGTGVYSPVTSPYESPGPRYNDPSVSEDDYADYMLRYLLIALCSGMVDRVFWWRLVARGYGLVDDADAARWRERPAYLMLKMFLENIRDCVFERKPASRPGVEAFMFNHRSGRQLCVIYSTRGDMTVEPPFACSRVTDAFGRAVPVSPSLTLTGRPIYMFG
ncbi:MAG: hypothetical protein C0404_12420 [Verrucomicrobia bacterium]|nr:hypothetical protein [Verrucomicrobiota bacterium]